MVFRDFFFQAEDGIRDSVASRGLGNVYKRQEYARHMTNILHDQYTGCPKKNCALFKNAVICDRQQVET